MKSRKFTPILVSGVAVTVLMLAGCASGSSSNPEDTSSGDSGGVISITPELVAAAQTEGTVSIRFGDPQAQIDALIKDFTATYPGVTVVQDRTAGAAAGAKMLQEAQSGVKQIDVFEGTDFPSMLELDKQGYIENLPPENYADFPDWAKLGNGFYAQNAVQEVVAYNTNLFDPSKASELQDWEKVASAAPAGKLGIFSLTLSTGIGPFLYGETQIGPSWMEGVAEAKPVVSDASASARDALVAGQTAVTLGQWDAVMDQLVAVGAPVAYVYPNPSPSWGGGYWGLVKDAPHPNAAKLWFAYVLSKTACDVTGAAPLYVKCTLTNWTDNREVALPDGSEPSWLASATFTEDYPMPIDVWDKSQEVRDRWDSLNR